MTTLTTPGEQTVAVGTEPVLEVTNLEVTYKRRGSTPLKAVNGVDLRIMPGTTLGLVGESGSGKSTLGRAVLGLAPISGGTVRVHGRDVTKAGRSERRSLSRDLQVIFQDPYGSLNPTKTIGATLAEPMMVHKIGDRAAVSARVDEVLREVGMPADAAQRYPNAFSGGQRQRIAIARALMMQPSLIVCDEPVSALDLSIQAQVLNLLNRLQKTLGLSYLFISHDLAVVRYFAEEIVVLYKGEIVERGPSDEVYNNPQHAYTQRLLSATPQV